MIVINGEIFKGQQNSENVFQDICTSFESMPSGCTKWLKKEGVQLPELEDGLSMGGLLLVLFLLIVINTAVFFIYKKFVKEELDKEMKMQVSSAVSQYVALS